MISAHSVVVAGLLLALAGDAVAQSPARGERVSPPPGKAMTTDGREVTPPVKTNDIRPVYPESAFRAGLMGVVVLECAIDTDGKVTDVTVVHGYRSLAAASIDALRQSRYTPTRLNGTPVPVILTVTTSFSFGGNPRRDYLLASVSDPDPEIRASAITWIATLPRPGDKERKAIAAALHDRERLVRLAATNAQHRLKRR